jgi:RNA polymerase sigma factor (sigma-70 family)
VPSARRSSRGYPLAERANQDRRASASSKAWGRGLTPEQLREAERGLKVGLARKFSAQWIAEHHRDLLAQANAEYLEWLEENPPARNPVGWIINCANWRAINLLDAETRRPPSAPLDAVALRIADESTPTPEQHALDRDRRRRLDDALRRLPEKEQQLLALVYFDGHSIREAGRIVGWGKSAADRHHTAAMEKMAALVGDRRYLSPSTLVLILFGAARDAVKAPLRAARNLAHRIAPLAESAAPVTTTGGAGRALAQCGAVVTIALCSLVAAPTAEQGVRSVLGSESDQAAAHHHSPRPEIPAAVEPTRSPAAASSSARARESERKREDGRLRRRRRRQQARARASRSAAVNRSRPAPEPAPEPIAPPSEVAEPAPPPVEEAPPAPAGGAGPEFEL